MVTYTDYKIKARRKQLESLLKRILEEGTETDVSVLRSFLDWMVLQVQCRARVGHATAQNVTAKGEK